MKALSAEIARRRGGTQPVRYLLALVAVALVYWAAARLSLNLADKAYRKLRSLPPRNA